MYFYMLIFWMMSLISMMMSVIFITLWERKLMSYIGLRKGPKKVSFIGLFQPISDSMKLIIKELGNPNISNSYLFWLFPLLSCLMLFMMWLFFYFYNSIIIFYLSMMGLICCSSVKVYIIIGGGWGSKSKFSFLGCLRGSAQSISYEVILMFMIFFPCIYSFNYSTEKKFFKKKNIFFGYLLIFFIWLMVCLSETNRSPFDFMEGESELVSGFKMEYGALQFIFLYLFEYGSMMFFSFFSSNLFFNFQNYFFCKVLGIIMVFFFIWMRSSLPRFRYDLLMELSWIMILPFILLYLFLIFN